jgi:hypothetical protein
MIYAVLKGGLGNQLFIMAAALEQARRLDVDLGLICEFNPHTPHAVYGFSDLELPKRVFVQDPFKNRFSRYFSMSSRKHYTESQFSYQPEIEKIKDGTILSGYFQSWRYFYNVRSEIWEMFESFRDDERIDAEESAVPKISIHLRRGDYTTAHNLDFYVQLGESYYQRAIRQADLDLQSHVTLPAIKCFSDSNEEARKMFPSDRVSMAEESDPLRTLLAMSDCNALITANSSFSWWGGWLASHRQAKVYCPSKWFLSQDKNIEDLCPKDWQSLSVE